MSNKILFFGNERLASGVATKVPVLRALIQAGYDITGVVIAQSERGASRRTREPEIVQVARAHNIPTFVPTQPRELLTELTSAGAEIGVLAAYGKIVPVSIIDLFPRGIINIHPSLLPHHRGPTPIESAILSGEAETGVSLMQLAVGMDSGPLYDQKKVRLSGHETKTELVETLASAGKDMLLEALPGILDGSRVPTPQDHTKATYDKLLTKELSSLDWQKTAERLAREVRAYAGWPRSRTVLDGVEIIVTGTHLGSGQGKPGSLWRQAQQFGIYTSDGVLIIDSLIPNGKKEMSGKAFLAGYLKKSL